MNEEYKKIVDGTMGKLLSFDQITFAERYKIMQGIELLLNEWMHLRELIDEQSAPLPTPDANE